MATRFMCSWWLIFEEISVTGYPGTEFKWPCQYIDKQTPGSMEDRQSSPNTEVVVHTQIQLQY